MRTTQTYRPTCRRTQQGSALIVVVGYLAVMTIFASGLLHLLHMHMSASIKAEREQVCLALAEGGLAKGLVALRKNIQDYRGEENTPLGEGRFSVTVTPGAAAGHFEIHAVAQLLDNDTVYARAAAQATVILSETGDIRSLKWKEGSKHAATQ